MLFVFSPIAIFVADSDLHYLYLGHNILQIKKYANTHILNGFHYKLTV